MKWAHLVGIKNSVVQSIDHRRCESACSVCMVPRKFFWPAYFGRRLQMLCRPKASKFVSITLLQRKFIMCLTRGTGIHKSDLAPMSDPLTPTSWVAKWSSTSSLQVLAHLQWCRDMQKADKSLGPYMPRILANPLSFLPYSPLHF